jgi:hypothetical protein
MSATWHYFPGAGMLMLGPALNCLSKFSPYFLIYYPIGQKFAIQGLHVTVLGVYKFRENRRREGRSFVTGVNEIGFVRVKVKNA